ncbi:hypothetical protein [Bacillus sp. Bva_UNVM-123]
MKSWWDNSQGSIKRKCYSITDSGIKD